MEITGEELERLALELASVRSSMAGFNECKAMTEDAREAEEAARRIQRWYRERCRKKLVDSEVQTEMSINDMIKWEQ